jgi:hypothetical protein
MSAAVSFGFGRVTIVRLRGKGKIEKFVMNRTEFGGILQEGLNSGIYSFGLHPKSSLRNVHPRGWVHGHRSKPR